MDRHTFFKQLSEAYPRSFTKFDPAAIPHLREEFDAALIMLALARVHDHIGAPNRKAAAKLFGITRNTLCARMKKLKVETR